MRFIKKNGRAIPIRDSNAANYKTGYATTGVLAGAGITSYQAGLYKVQKSMKQSLFAAMRGREGALMPRGGKIGAGLAATGIGMMVASKINAAYHIMRSPKGERAGELAKHGASAAVGYKVGTYASLPFIAGNLRHGIDTMASVVRKRPTEVNWSGIAKHVLGMKHLGAGKSPRLLKD